MFYPKETCKSNMLEQIQIITFWKIFWNSEKKKRDVTQNTAFFIRENKTGKGESGILHGVNERSLLE